MDDQEQEIEIEISRYMFYRPFYIEGLFTNDISVFVSYQSVYFFFFITLYYRQVQLLEKSILFFSQVTLDKVQDCLFVSLFLYILTSKGDIRWVFRSTKCLRGLVE